MVWAVWGERELSYKQIERARPGGDLAGLSHSDFQDCHWFQMRKTHGGVPNSFLFMAERFSGFCNRWFIRDALKAAIEQLGIMGEQALRLDHDTKDEPGTLDIPYVIYEKISSSAIMVAECFAVGATSEGQGLPDPNVMVELGYGAHCLGWERIILVMNAHFGAPKGSRLTCGIDAFLYATVLRQQKTERPMFRGGLLKSFAVLFPMALRVTMLKLSASFVSSTGR